MEKKSLQQIVSVAKKLQAYKAAKKTILSFDGSSMRYQDDAGNYIMFPIEQKQWEETKHIDFKQFEKLVNMLEKTETLSLSSCDNKLQLKNQQDDVYSFEHVDYENLSAENQKGYAARPGLEHYEEPSMIFRLDGELLSSTFQKVLYAVSEEETRYYLKGMYVEHQMGFIKCRCTDGHRLAINEVYANMSLDFESFILPANVCHAMQAMLSSCKDAMVTFYRSNKTFRVEVDCKNGKAPIEFHFRQVDGKFPDFRNVIPNENHKKVRSLVETKQLSKGLSKAVKVFCEVKFNVNGSLQIHAQNNGFSFDTTIPCSNEWLGDCDRDLDIGFNGNYILDVCKLMKQHEHVRLDFTSPLEPVKLTSGCDDDKSVHIVMPMRL